MLLLARFANDPPRLADCRGCCAAGSRLDQDLTRSGDRTRTTGSDRERRTSRTGGGRFTWNPQGNLNRTTGPHRATE
ncbi:hypothetical protein Krad_0686 [Kineococcus radiotolerans SRS30216 = ATCC BAA-149]|uniref:Uncharacterized protein n=1 Tax=Kineococcus radiotolerans (strain ATCC BAA-149 / DSM 14245 / SRS30216) TaxID=266940 RepID=A6W5T6_KINRD|nr:hypothetical protein Krad_0686 [Kineococcus radiotolerans SRS30216 = ATCC BAA-149]